MRPIDAAMFVKLAGGDLNGAVGVACEFRSATRRVWFGPAIAASRGGEIVAAVSEAGEGFEAVLDSRVSGDDKEVADAVTAVSAQGAWGLTVRLDGPAPERAAAAARRGADRAVLFGHRARAIKLIATPMPFPADDDAWAAARQTWVGRRRFLEAMCETAVAHKFYGVHLDARDADVAAGMGLRVFAEASSPAGHVRVRGGLDPFQLFDKGVDHPLYDPARFAKVVSHESAADMLYAGIASRQREAKRNQPLDLSELLSGDFD
jgi:hypothetical protein